MYNNEFKNINSPEKAYLLGLFYSDGCIYSNDGHYYASIVLHEDDKYLLNIIINKFPFFRLSKHSKCAWSIVCTMKAIVEDLQANGMYFRKSTDNKELLRLPNLDKELIHHFIRGYFDGDGSVYRQKLGNTKFDIGGTGFNMITDIIKVLYDNGITVNMTCKYAVANLRKHDYYVLYASSDKISKQFANYIYKNCGDLYMKRKYDKLYYIPEYHKRERLICPICKGTNTIRTGTRQMLHGLVYRGKCKDCKKQFSITAPQSSNTLSGGDELLEG